MTEQEWLECTHPAAMLNALGREWDKGHGYWIISERRLRLFACAISRLLLSGSTEGLKHMAQIEALADDPQTDWYTISAQIPHPGGGYWCAEPEAARGLCELLGSSYVRDRGEYFALMFRCIAGNPFGPAPLRWQKGKLEALTGMAQHGFHPPAPYYEPVSWLTWNDGAIPRIAADLYERRAWEELPVLADALEESGCALEDMLAHLRGPGPHARGCWVVDTLLNKE